MLVAIANTALMKCSAHTAAGGAGHGNHSAMVAMRMLPVLNTILQYAMKHMHGICTGMKSLASRLASRHQVLPASELRNWPS